MCGEEPQISWFMVKCTRCLFQFAVCVVLYHLQSVCVCVHRWLGYLSLLLFDVLICLLVLFGLIRNSRGILIG